MGAALGAAQWIALALAALRLGEVLYGRRNARRLLAAGGREFGRRHYPLVILLHGGWLAALFVAVPAERAPNLPLLALFAAIEAARYAVIATLGPWWTTRVITVPGRPLVRRGPYRYVRHPNYLLVAAGIAVLPLAFGAWQIAVVFSLANGALLWHRVRVENAALAPRRDL